MTPIDVKINILMVGTARKAMSGITGVVNRYYESSLPDRVNLTYVASYCDGTWLRKAFKALGAYMKFVFVVLTSKVDLVHVHASSYASFYRKQFFLYVAKLFGKKVICHIHGSEFKKFHDASRINAFLIRKTFEMADAVIALSERWRDTFLSYADSPNVVVLYNPVNTKKYASHNASVDGRVRFVYMGILSRRKGIYDLLEIIPEIARKDPEVLFYICGNGDVDNAKKIAAEKKIERNVEITGWVGEQAKLDVFSKSDIFILPTYNEGFPSSVMEAMASRLPVITTPVGGIPEQIEDGVNGFLVTPGDTKGLLEKSLLLLQSPEMRRQMGEINLEKVKEEFDLETIVARLIGIYASVNKNGEVICKDQSDK